MTLRSDAPSPPTEFPIFVVEHGQHGNTARRQFQRVVIGAPKAEFFAVKACEDDRSGKLRRRHHARRLQNRGDARGVVVGAGGRSDSIGAMTITVVKVARHDVDASRIGSAQGCYHTRLKNGTRSSRRLRLQIRIERDAHAPAGRRCNRGKLRCDPIARGKDAVRSRRRPFGKIVPRAERDEPIDVAAQPIGLHGIDHCLNRRVGREPG